jgi:5-methylcytosine-specific restriction endonuclease McrA
VPLTREERNEYTRLWRLANLEKSREAGRRCYSAHLENYREASIQYRRANPETRRATGRMYRRANLEKDAAHSARRRAQKRSATFSSFGIAQIYARCAELRQWFDVVVDHVIPLAKGGAHAAGNLQIIYAVENAAKGARLDFVPTVVFR